MILDPRNTRPTSLVAALALGASICLFLAPPPAHSKTCKHIAPWQMLEHSEVVFEGTVLGDALPDLPEEDRKFTAVALRLRVDRRWVGETDDEVIVTGDYDLLQWLDHVGESYFFCGGQSLLIPGQRRADSGFLRTSECKRNSQLECAEVELFAIELLVRDEPKEAVADQVAGWLLTHLPSGHAPNCELPDSRSYSRDIWDLAASMQIVGPERRAQILDFVERECSEPERAKHVLASFTYYVGDEWPGSVDWLTRMLQDPNPEIRASAVSSTTRRPIEQDPRIVPLLVRATQDEDAEPPGGR
ncbi:MAG: HEAT repeat domain-containing protein [Candidatus Eisenbacteria bacterium]